MERKCGCWAVLRRSVSVKGTGCKPSSASKDSANSIPRTSLVYDAGIYFYTHKDTYFMWICITLCAQFYWCWSDCLVSVVFIDFFRNGCFSLLNVLRVYKLGIICFLLKSIVLIYYCIFLNIVC